MILETIHIDKAFGAEKVLDSLSLQLGEHEMLSILGRSGSGKTTLLKILAGLEAPLQANAVPEPGTFTLFGFGLLVAGSGHRC